MAGGLRSSPQPPRAAAGAWLEIADQAYVLKYGQIVYSGTAAELGADEWHLAEVPPA
jgi:ABC-type branched-subunit amino acid transport system ATPase component